MWGFGGAMSRIYEIDTFLRKKLQEILKFTKFGAKIKIKLIHEICRLKNKKESNRFFGMISITKNDTERVLRVVDYHNQCMKHLNFTYGMAHAEYIIDDKSGQAYLLEVNNRISGADIPHISNKCYHSDEVNLFLNLLESKSEINEFDFTKIFSYGVIPYFSNYTNPNSTKLDLSSLVSEHNVITFRPGISATANSDNGQLFDKISAVIWLLNDDHAELIKDLKHLRDLEANGKLFI